MVSFRLLPAALVFLVSQTIAEETPQLRGAPATDESERRLSAPRGYSPIYASNGNCLGIAGGSTRKWSPLKPERCSNGGNQQFEFRNRGEGYEIKVQHSGQCMAISKNAFDLRIIEQRPCPRRNVRLILWNVEEAGGGYQIRSVHTNKCFSIHNGAIFQKDCNGDDDQVFDFSGPPSGGGGEDADDDDAEWMDDDWYGDEMEQEEEDDDDDDDEELEDEDEDYKDELEDFDEDEDHSY